MFNISTDELTARIELERTKNVGIRLSSSGDRILVTALKNNKDPELLVFKSCGGTFLFGIPAEKCLSSVACCHDAYYVLGYLDGVVSVWNALSGALESIEHQKIGKYRCQIRNLLCFNGIEDRPYSCLSHKFNSRQNINQLSVWDAVTRETYMSFNPDPIVALESSRLVVRQVSLSAWDL